MSAHQGKCYREAIAWAGAQDWSTGAVGLCGVSFLCISQYLAAAVPEGETLPDALKCIVPWEGVSDLYRDLACRGGVADVGFLNFWWLTEVKESLNLGLEEYLSIEEAIPVDVLKTHPFYDEYWKAKAPRVENITVPMLVCASFSDHELHTFGSFRAYEKSSSEQKWLYTHRSGKWTEFYKQETSDLIKSFMDRFLKGEQTDFPDKPSVRLEVRKDRNTIHDIRWENTWPIENTSYVALHLAENTLSLEPKESPAFQSYDGKEGRTEFTYIFPQDTEISGYIKLKVWVEAKGAEDMALCCFIDKRDHAAKTVRFNGAVGQEMDMLTRGYGCALMQQLDEAASVDWHPVPLCETKQLLLPGHLVPLEIAFCPISTFFEAGERLVLIISGRDVVHAPIFKKDVSYNQGTHVLHFGGMYDAHLLLPYIPRASDTGVTNARLGPSGYEPT